MAIEIDSVATATEAWHLNDLLSKKFPFNENTAESQALKTLHEAEEFASDPSLAEAADVIVTVFQWAIKEKKTLEQLMGAVYDKTLVNLNRQWSRKPDGTLQHN